MAQSPVVRVDVPPPSGGRRRARLTRLIAVLLLGALTVAALPSLLSGQAPSRPAPHPQHASPAIPGEIFFDPNNPGIDGIAAAFKGPLRCMRLTFADGNPTYVRADAGAGLSCSRPLGPEVFHEVGAFSWRLVLSGLHHPCPAPEIPPAVQAELRICQPVRRG